MKEKDEELKNVKSDCAAALLGKEKTLHVRLNDLNNEVSDLKFTNQKQLQHIHDLETKLQHDARESLEEHQRAMKEKEKAIK